MTELVGCGAVARGEVGFVRAAGVALGKALLTVRVHAGQDRADERSHGNRRLDDFKLSTAVHRPAR